MPHMTIPVLDALGDRDGCLHQIAREGKLVVGDLVIRAHLYWRVRTNVPVVVTTPEATPVAATDTL